MATKHSEQADCLLLTKAMLCSETKGKPVFKDLPVIWKQIKPHWQNPVHSNEAETLEKKGKSLLPKDMALM